MYLRIPESNIPGVVATGVAKISGVILTTGNAALDGVELLLGTTQEKIAFFKKQIYSIQSEAIQKASTYERQAVLKVNDALSPAVSDGLNSFLNKVLPDRVARVQIDSISVAPTAEILHRKALEQLDSANNRISTILAESTKLSKSTVRKVDTVLGTVEASLTTILTAVATFRVLINTLKIPVAALKATIIVIKALPLPQRYLIVSFTILESDMLEMMTELVVQVDELIQTIETVLSGIEASLRPLRDRIRRIRARLAALQVDDLFLNASLDDLNILDQAGLYDKNSGESLFDKIQTGQGSNSSWETYGRPGGTSNGSGRTSNGFGGTSNGSGRAGSNSGTSILAGLETTEAGKQLLRFGVDDEDSGLDLTKPEIGNQLLLAEPGDFIRIESDTSGSYTEDLYKWQDTAPSSDELQQLDGWTRYPDSPSSNETSKLWKVSLAHSGGKTRYLGDGDDLIVEVPGKDWKDLFETIDQFKSIQAGVGNKSTREGENINFDPLKGFQFSQDILILGENNFDQKPGILKPSSWDNLEVAALNKLRNLPLSEELQESLTNLWQNLAIEEASTTTAVDNSVDYRAANGELYHLRVIEDDHSPKVAVRRYVQVKDESGTVILEGTKTFSLDKEMLIEEMKLQLDQLTR